MTHPTPLAEKIAAIRKGLHHECPLAHAALDALAKDVAAMEAERDALRAQIHDLCHDIHTQQPVTPQEFCDGCEAFQVKLFGESPITQLRSAALAAAAKGQGTVRT
jgi:hypothetical protein